MVKFFSKTFLFLQCQILETRKSVLQIHTRSHQNKQFNILLLAFAVGKVINYIAVRQTRSAWTAACKLSWPHLEETWLSLLGKGQSESTDLHMLRSAWVASTVAVVRLC